MDIDALVSTLYDESNRTQDAKGLPVYEINLKSAIERGFTLDNIKKAANNIGIRTKKHKTGLSVRTYDLRHTIKKILEAAK